uniref:Uncharacterized protein n=2 Tax=Candidatus Kentrum sp. LFY TaxID=2126342 RepID=A0A450USZ1_9GAMM|nr:MAG: hypothetical protein BECKLFY1418A_GA0070994_10523 [Candidatus Kentron sp. LFY]
MPKGLIEILGIVSANKIALTFTVVSIAVGVASSLVFTVGFGETTFNKAVIGLSLKWWTLILVSLSICVFLITTSVMINKDEARYEGIKRYNPSDDQLRDIENFLKGNMEIMDSDELATKQLDAYQIQVVAPEPLEIWSD